MIDLQNYKIEIFPHEDEEMKECGTPYFWCVLKWTGESWVNSGVCGWSKSTYHAFADATIEFNEKIVKSK